MSWYKKFFINEAKPALEHQAGIGSGSGSDGTQMYILVDEDGNEYPAVLVDEETVFDATANDIREGKIAATESGVTVGTKDIPAYYVAQGYVLIPVGKEFKIPFVNDMYDFTRLQAAMCKWSGKLATSVSTDKISVEGMVYPVNSTEALSTVTKDSENKVIDMGVSNDGGSLYILRYFTYREVH